MHEKKSKKKLTSVSFAFTHTYTLEKLTLLLFFMHLPLTVRQNFAKVTFWSETFLSEKLF